MRPTKKGSSSWRFETVRKDYGEVMALAEKACSVLEGRIVLRANLHGRSLPFIRAGSVQPGMAMIGADGVLDIVDTVFHPALANRLPPGLTGTSGLFSFTFREGIDIRAFADHLTLFKLGVSWGGHESLIVPGEVVLQQKAQPNSAHAFGIDARSVRLHVGLEGTEALWRDLEAAMEAATEN